MSAPKRGLGRGLDVLLGQPRAAVDGLRQIPVASIRPNPQQPRTSFRPEALAELELSIRELGVLVPIIVRPLRDAEGEAYELIAGERRWRASAAAHLDTIPAIVRDADDRTSLEVAVVENLQRSDLDPIEEAMGFQHLIDDYGFTQERLSERIGKSRPAIANALRLTTLSEPLKGRLRTGALSAGHARALLAVDESEREALAERIEREGLSVRDIERFGARRPRAAGAKRAARKSADLEALEGRLRFRLGSMVTLTPAVKGGRLEVRYAGDDDLARIVDVILGDEP